MLLVIHGIKVVQQVQLIFFLNVSALLNQKGRKYFMKKLFLEIAQSTIFLSCNGFSMLIFFCLIRKLFGGYYIWSAGFLPGCLSSLTAISLERKSRRGALAIYMLNQALDTIFIMLKQNGLARDIPYGEVIIFAAATSALSYMYRTDNLQDGFFKSLMRKGDVREMKKNLIVSKAISDEKLHMQLSVKLAGKAFILGYGIQSAYNLLMTLLKAKNYKGLLSKVFLSNDSIRFGGFISSLVFLFNMSEKMLQKSNKGKGGLNAALAGGVAGCAMFLNKSSYISLYTLSKTFELFYMNGIQKGNFPYIKHFDTMLYTVCTGLMFHAAILQPSYLKPTYWNFLLKLTGKRFHEIDRSHWNVFGYKYDGLSG